MNGDGSMRTRPAVTRPEVTRPEVTRLKVWSVVLHVIAIGAGVWLGVLAFGWLTA